MTQSCTKAVKHVMHTSDLKNLRSTQAQHDRFDGRYLSSYYEKGKNHMEHRFNHTVYVQHVPLCRISNLYFPAI